MNKSPSYHDFLSAPLQEYLLSQAKEVKGVDGLVEIGESGGLESSDSLNFLCILYKQLSEDLGSILEQRVTDRSFIDERVKVLNDFNIEHGLDVKDEQFQSILGLKDSEDEIVIGPRTQEYSEGNGKKIAGLPEYLKGNHVTLFGPPDTEKMSINAMNSYHRKLDGEPAIVEKLLEEQNNTAMWGADDEDSKTPLRADLIKAGINLSGCVNKSISFEDKKKYSLEKNNLALPIKRFPGLALPCTFLFLNNKPIPLHLYDFALHLFENYRYSEALTFYVPKLENEFEALYIHKMISTAEQMIKNIHPEYELGTVRLMIVLENPRAIFRTNEIIDALYPYFAGASLGWHDYLASTARVFKEDSQYRIPVKADPNIVIKYIKASHELLADVVGSRGGIKVGGMYGILPIDRNISSDSFQITLRGYFKEVITQLKRDLNGFWVAHPDFVRIGLALVESWKKYKNGSTSELEELISGLLNKKYSKEVLDFIKKDDIESLNRESHLYERALLAADIKESDFIANNHPDEIRYNVFQSLQYITDWLSGNGCVALPTQIEGQAVRVMDDLATAERSRWEVWHELYHGRFELSDFLRIAFEELRFIKKDLSNEKKIVEVKWNESNERWYPVAFKLMVKLMSDEKPVEFATELLLPFTIEGIRESEDPWQEITKIDPSKFKLNSYVDKFLYYFEFCGHQEFSHEMAKNSVLDLDSLEQKIMNFSIEGIIEAASFHGDIGESQQKLDKLALEEQKLVSNEKENIKQELRNLGKEYQRRFGFKFLVAAKGRPASEIKNILKTRLENKKEIEIENAKQALFEITQMRVNEKTIDFFSDEFKALKDKLKINDASVSITDNGHTQSVGSNERFQIASLSKTIASAFSIEFFSQSGISLDTKVDALLTKMNSPFKLKGEFASELSLKHLMNHSALNLHYVNGFSATSNMPSVLELIQGMHGYNELEILNRPGSVFNYSGGGFLLLEYLIESLSGKSIIDITKKFINELGIESLTFNQEDNVLSGYKDTGEKVESSSLMFPAFAAGAYSSSEDMNKFLGHLDEAYHCLEGSGPISHNTAVQMLYGSDLGSQKFMASDMGLGVFIAYAGDNKFALHQGANDGFRSIFLYCFDGPDRGRGISAFCNAELNGIIFNALIMQKALVHLNVKGVDFTRFNSSFDTSALSQEQIVNIGYKELILNAFEQPLASEIKNRVESSENSALNIATSALITFCSNQKFARAENLISPLEPVFDPTTFEKQGKTMDSWESARHSQTQVEYLDLELKEKSSIKMMSFSTKFHDGNHVPEVSVLSEVDGEWSEIVPRTKLDGHAIKYIKTNNNESHKTLRIITHPDGGLTRLGLYQNEITPSFEGRYKESIPTPTKPLSIPVNVSLELNQKSNLASSAYGAKIVSVSNEHYGNSSQLISPFNAVHMFDGLESARSRTSGHYEEVVIELAEKAQLGEIIFNFEYFVNNNPTHIEVQGISSGKTITIVEKSLVKIFAANKVSYKIDANEIFEQLRVIIYPDGGINRIYVYAK